MSEYRVFFSGDTHVGRVREQNEDNIKLPRNYPQEALSRYGYLFVVADGVGGNRGGAIASEMACQRVFDYFYQSSPAESGGDPLQRLESAVSRADRDIRQDASRNPELREMSCTLAAVVVKQNMAYLAHLGDARVYLLRRNQLKQLTEDHSWVQEQVRNNVLTEEEAERHPNRNVITRSMGGSEAHQADFSKRVLENGDRLLLCSDGLCGPVSKARLKYWVGQNNPAHQPSQNLSQIVHHLIDNANKEGGHDNITAAVVQIGSFAPPVAVSSATTRHQSPTPVPVRKRRSDLGYGLLALAIVVPVIVGLFWLFGGFGESDSNTHLIETDGNGADTVPIAGSETENIESTATLAATSTLVPASESPISAATTPTPTTPIEGQTAQSGQGSTEGGGVDESIASGEAAEIVPSSSPASQAAANAEAPNISNSGLLCDEDHLFADSEKINFQWSANTFAHFDTSSQRLVLVILQGTQSVQSETVSMNSNGVDAHNWLSPRPVQELGIGLGDYKWRVDVMNSENRILASSAEGCFRIGLKSGDGDGSSTDSVTPTPEF